MYRFNLKIFFLLFFSLLFSFSSRGQEIANVDFSIEGSTIVVTYDLINCPDKSFYNIELSFIDRKEKNIIPFSVEGDLKRVYPGKGKKIIWKYTSDIENLESDISAVVKIVESFSTKIKGGPENAILSMILPGWGDRYVNKVKKSSPILVSLSYLGLAGYGFYQKTQSDNYYNLYKAATTQTQMDEQYKLASEANQTVLLCAGGAALIWIIDVISVISKGSKNVKELKQKNSRAFSFQNIQPRILLANANQPTQIGFIKRF
ncbi:MAG: hypothetical protein EBX50_11440 [Chitinophagia bacterium]|nr:hypothetical protein [Chitinophagia bacterium]